MRIVHRSVAGERVVELDVGDPERPVADLVRALVGRPAATGSASSVVDPIIDGDRVAADSPLSAVALCEGSVVDTTDRAPAGRTPARILAVVGGLRAGVAVDATVPLTIGRHPACRVRVDDPALSRRHLSLSRGLAADLGSRNGTAVDGHPLVGPIELPDDAIVRAGSSRFSLRRPPVDRPVAVAAGFGAAGGTIPFNRPPRPLPSSEPVILEAPGHRPDPPAAEPLSVAGIVLPILAGAVVALLFSPFMAIFAALGPVLTVGTWWERRRRNRRDHHHAMLDYSSALVRLQAALPDARRREIRRRRTLHPDLAEVVRRASVPSATLWERRADASDAFVVAIASTDEAFRPRLVPVGADVVGEEAERAVAACDAMPDVPVPVDLSPGRIVGLVGDRAATLAIARSLVLQAATHHGPADLHIVVGADRPDEWRWAEWLPHTADQASGRRGRGVLATTDLVGAAAALAAVGSRAGLAVLDGADPFQGRVTVGRHLLSSPRMAAIVLAPEHHRLPASCDTVVRVDASGRLEVIDPRQADPGRVGLGWGLARRTAEVAARRMARLDDPELPLAGAGVPGAAPLLDLLSLGGDEPAEIEARWVDRDGTADLAVPIGADRDGPLVLDFVADGPHVLIGGTTGSGKSELLRSIVAALAATADPDHVAMVLVDYKGGAAFDCCGDLPHVAGLVTDLDAGLAARALRCLEAELRRREAMFRSVGADDMASFRLAARARPDQEPLPRLVVVVDEFASLAADLPEFLDALVGVAQRGRSLGVHMILATQRPGGVVTDDIRANTACRLALRVTDRGDSLDVIDAPDAAAITRDRPGRAVARFGPEELVPFQGALVTGHSSDTVAGVTVRGPGDDHGAASVAGPTDLERLVTTIGAAHRARGGRRPRPPWPPALPPRLDRAQTAAAPDQWWLVDEPDEQRQRLGGWTPADGHLVVIGGPGAGSTTTLATASLAISRRDDPPHLHVIDLDAGRLLALAALTNVGTTVGPGDTTRRRRLLRWLDEEVQRRRTHGHDGAPEIVLVVDDLAGLARAHDVVREATLHDAVARIWADGPSVGVILAVSLRRGTDLAPDLAATIGTVLLHRTADQADGLRVGVRGHTDDFPAGRARQADGRELQVILDGSSIEESIAARSGRPALLVEPHEVGELAEMIVADEHAPSSVWSTTGVELAFVVRDRDLSLGSLRLHRRDHALVLGPARSGRTAALVAMARAAGRAAVVVGDGELARRSGLEPTNVEQLPARLALADRAVVLVDDALDVDDPTGELGRIVTGEWPGVHLVVSARPDRYRAAYGHWTAEIKMSRAGLLLRPEVMDGDLLGQQFPARLDVAPVPGRGVMVSDGVAELMQVVWCESQSTS